MKVTCCVLTFATILAPDCLLAAKPSAFERLVDSLDDLVGHQNESLYGRGNEAEEHWESQHKYKLSDSGRIDWNSSRWQSLNERSGSQGEGRNKKVAAKLEFPLSAPAERWRQPTVPPVFRWRPTPPLQPM